MDNTNTYRAVIHDLTDKINNTKYVKRLCQLATYLYTDDMNIIKNLSAGDLFTVIGYSFDYGFYQGMQYMKDKQKRKAGKKLIPGSRASKIHELMELAGKIPDKRLDALLCWANQYQQGEGEPDGV